MGLARLDVGVLDLMADDREKRRVGAYEDGPDMDAKNGDRRHRGAKLNCKAWLDSLPSESLSECGCVTNRMMFRRFVQLSPTIYRAAEVWKFNVVFYTL